MVTALDNAIAESFFKTLKTELVYYTNYLTKEQAKLFVFENKNAIHSQ
jgi:transposase InsO family protein